MAKGYSGSKSGVGPVGKPGGGGGGKGGPGGKANYPSTTGKKSGAKRGNTPKK